MRTLPFLFCAFIIFYASDTNANTIYFSGYITSPGCKTSYSSQSAVLNCKDNVATPDTVNFNVNGKTKIVATGMKVLIDKKDENNTLVTINYS